MEILNVEEALQVGGGDVSGLGPYTPSPTFVVTDPDLEWFLQWKMMNPGYPYDQLVDQPLGGGQ